MPRSRSDDVIYRLDAQLSKASSIWTTRTFRPGLPLCWEALNCSSLNPSGRFSSTSDATQYSIKLWDFFPKHRYGKTVATVRMMWIVVRTRSSIRQVAHSKIRRPDARTSYMKIACIRFTVWKTDVVVWTRQALIWKLLAAKVRPFGWQGNTVWTRLNSGKIFSKIWKADRTVVRPDGA
jgi:hypothetical protein